MRRYLRSQLRSRANTSYSRYNRTSFDDPFVVRVETGIFTGAYTIDEQDQFVWSGKPAASMWLMTIPPFFAWVTVRHMCRYGVA